VGGERGECAAPDCSEEIEAKVSITRHNAIQTAVERWQVSISIMRDSQTSIQPQVFGTLKFPVAGLPSNPMTRNKHVPMNRIVRPSAALLHPNLPPLSLRQKAALGQCLGEFLW